MIFITRCVLISGFGRPRIHRWSMAMRLRTARFRLPSFQVKIHNLIYVFAKSSYGTYIRDASEHLTTCRKGGVVSRPSHVCDITHPPVTWTCVGLHILRLAPTSFSRAFNNYSLNEIAALVIMLYDLVATIRQWRSRAMRHKETFTSRGRTSHTVDHFVHSFTRERDSQPSNFPLDSQLSTRS